MILSTDIAIYYYIYIVYIYILDTHYYIYLELLHIHCLFYIYLMRLNLPNFFITAFIDKLPWTSFSAEIRKEAWSKRMNNKKKNETYSFKELSYSLTTWSNTSTQFNLLMHPFDSSPWSWQKRKQTVLKEYLGDLSIFNPLNYIKQISCAFDFSFGFRS